MKEVSGQVTAFVRKQTREQRRIFSEMKDRALGVIWSKQQVHICRTALQRKGECQLVTVLYRHGPGLNEKNTEESGTTAWPLLGPSFLGAASSVSTSTMERAYCQIQVQSLATFLLTHQVRTRRSFGTPCVKQLDW